jgi:transcriptional regulator with XRE-family HTH domain
MNGTMESAHRLISPDELAIVIKIYRQVNGWTQETLAEISGLTVRTIQRIENSEPSSVDTRRALARAFQIEDIDIFNKPHSFKSEEQIRKEAEEVEKNYVTLDVTVAKSGKDLADFAERMTMYCLQQADNVPRSVAEEVASLYDYLRDYGDVDELYSFAQKLVVHDELDRYLSTVKEAGYSICCALRNTKIVGPNWKDKTPLPVTIGYAFVVPKDREPMQARVPKAFRAGF